MQKGKCGNIPPFNQDHYRISAASFGDEAGPVFY
jgi:hypothetical protein